MTAERNIPGWFSALRNALLAVLAAVLLGACAAAPVRTITHPVMLPLPPRPVLTPVAPSDVACLSNTTYTTLVNRERALRTWGLELEAVITANNHHAIQGANHGH